MAHMEPTKHPFREENDLNQTSMIMFQVNLQGCIPSIPDNPSSNLLETTPGGSEFT